ncbi:hypothetical protein HAX54_040395 [Datura stramonium]|uniref:Uncharacterized protein n=1 Tax=Datura stramonium TaxID=4076 RepID=A0ABS8RNU9_DATST|nr:hypothetical protein [Datura stramonium]
MTRRGWRHQWSVGAVVFNCGASAVVVVRRSGEMEINRGEEIRGYGSLSRGILVEMVIEEKPQALLGKALVVVVGSLRQKMGHCNRRREKILLDLISSMAVDIRSEERLRNSERNEREIEGDEREDEEKVAARMVRRSSGL